MRQLKCPACLHVGMSGEMFISEPELKSGNIRTKCGRCGFTDEYAAFRFVSETVNAKPEAVSEELLRLSWGHELKTGRIPKICVMPPDSYYRLQHELRASTVANTKRRLKSAKFMNMNLVVADVPAIQILDPAEIAADYLMGSQHKKA